jgi:hypothetical protein
MLSIDTLAAELASYFAARSIAVEVVLGNWQEAQHAGADRVIVGLGDFDPDAPGTSVGLRPGVVIQTGATTAAQIVAVRTQEVVVWVHGVAPDGTSDAARTTANHVRTAQLLDATIAGLRRVVGRGALSFGKGAWPAAAIGDVTYGALARFKCLLDIPVLGDAWAVVPKPYSVQTQVVADLPGGEVTAAQTTTALPVDP